MHCTKSANFDFPAEKRWIGIQRHYYHQSTTYQNLRFKNMSQLKNYSRERTYGVCCLSFVATFFGLCLSLFLVQLIGMTLISYPFLFRHGPTSAIIPNLDFSLVYFESMSFIQTWSVYGLLLNAKCLVRKRKFTYRDILS